MLKKKNEKAGQIRPAGSGPEGFPSAGYGPAGNGPAGPGFTGNGSAGSGPAEYGYAGNGHRGYGPAGAGYAAPGPDRRSMADQGRLVYKEKKRLGFFGLPFSFTTYLIYDNDIQIKSGFLSSVENDCYMYRVIDVQLRISFLQRIFGLGTVLCVTSDATSKTIVLKNIRKAREIKDFIYRASEEAKLRRRTVNMQNIGAWEDLDGDGVPD